MNDAETLTAEERAKIYAFATNMVSGPPLTSTAVFRYMLRALATIDLAEKQRDNAIAALEQHGHSRACAEAASRGDDMCDCGEFVWTSSAVKRERDEAVAVLREMQDTLLSLSKRPHVPGHDYGPFFRDTALVITAFLDSLTHPPGEAGTTDG